MSVANPAATKQSPAPGPERCPHCQQWEAAGEDSYCGFCGRLLVKLSVKPEMIALIAGIAPRRIVVFNNSGPRPFRIKIVPADSRPFRAVVFDPPEFDMPAQRRVGVNAQLDEQLLPKNFVERRLRYRCEIDGDRRKSFPIEIAVKSGPKPHLTVTRLDFGQLEEGAVASRQIVVENRGGVPLALKEVRPEGSSQLSVAPGNDFPVKVMPGEKRLVGVVWDASREETEGPGKKGFRLAFGNHADEPFVEVHAKVYRRQLKIIPAELVLDDLFVKHDRVVRLKLQNQGTVDLQVEKIESGQRWIEIATEKTRFPLRPNEVHDFEVVVRPQQLAAGPHHGEVRVKTADRDQPDVVAVHAEVLHPEEYHDYIGIDFGTTNSVVAVNNPKGEQSIKVVKLPDAPQDTDPRLIPSLLVFLSSKNSFVTGLEARNEADISPEKIVRSIKRVMGAKNEHRFLGKNFSPEALATLIITSLVERAEKLLYQLSGSYLNVRKAIVTVPANFFDLQIRGILKACAAAGLDIEEEQARQAYDALEKTLGAATKAGIIIDEPSAAALFYLSHLERQSNAAALFEQIRSEKGLNVVIYDHGGGTLDVSLAHVREMPSRQPGITVLANRGDNRVGGESIDFALMKQLLLKCRHEFETFDDSLISSRLREFEARWQREGWDTPTRIRILRARNLWRDTVEKVKILLSDNERVTVKLYPYGILCRGEDGRLVNPREGYETQVSRDDLLSASEEALSRCEKVVKEVLEVAGLSAADVDYIFHTGRQSLMPAVRYRIKALFPDLAADRDRLDDEHLKVCVAKGAVMYGNVKSGMSAADAGVVFVDEGKRLPHSYGVEKITGFARRQFEPILNKGDVYPTRAEKSYSPEEVPPDNWLNLKIYENTGLDTEIMNNADIRQVGQIRIDTMADNVPGCDVAFAIDANRRLQVFADEKEMEFEPEAMEDEEGWAW